MKCFYHSADLDGHCSGAIVKKAHPECELIGINYGDEFPWDSIQEGERVFMVDFSLQPIEEMMKLQGLCKLVWIDHHKSAITAAIKADFTPMGIREVSGSACELCWGYCLTNDNMPTSVFLLGRYDVWDLDADPRVLPFQWGMRLNEDTRPDDNMDFWEGVFKNPVDGTVQVGTVCLAYQKAQNKKYISANVFETEFKGCPAIAVNKGLTNSQLFDSVWDENKYRMMITFIWRKGQWTVSLYTTHKDLDVGAIAKEMGGGGHPGAAGFQCKELPFDLK